MLMGYILLATGEKDFAIQRAALIAVGCRQTFEDKMSGAASERPELGRMLDQLREDDVVVVTSLDRLARSTRDLLEIAERLRKLGAGMRSLAEPWADTTLPTGRMVLTVFTGIAEFERVLVSQRFNAGRAAAKSRGVRFGRPSTLSADQVAHGRRLVAAGASYRVVAGLLECHYSTLYRALQLPL